jgi:hypothetical protein
MTKDEYIRALDELAKADHDELLARVQGWVDDAAPRAIMIGADGTWLISSG